MTPTDFRAGGQHVAIRFACGECSLGMVLVAATEKGLCAILLGNDAPTLRRELEERFPRARLLPGDRDFQRTLAQVVSFVEMPRMGLDLPLDVRGTAFQQRVWQALRAIPAGSRATYREIAERIAQGGARGGAGVRGERAGGGDSVSSRGAAGRRPRRLPLGRGAQAGAAGARDGGILG